MMAVVQDFYSTTGCAVAVLAIGLAAAVFIGVSLAVMNAQQKRRTFFDAAALRLKGRHIGAGFMSPDRIEFQLAGRPAVVEFVASGSRNEPPRTTVQARLDGPSPGTLHILEEGFAQSFLKMFGAQDLSVGDPTFDAAYVVKATPESLAARVFRPDRRDRVIAAVRRLSSFTHPTIEVVRGQLRIQVREYVQHEGSLLKLTGTAEDFLEFLHATVSGIELGDLRTSRESGCPVCGTAIGGRAVTCEACKTPHHEECWTYVGRCSTYACTGKRFTA